MKRLSPSALRLVLLAGMFLLSVFAAGAGVISFLLLRAGYGLVVSGGVPFLALVLAALVLGAGVWRLTSSGPADRGRSGGEKPGGGSGREARRGGPRRGDDV